MQFHCLIFFHSDGTFYLWETSTWASELWSSTSGLVTVSKIFTEFCKGSD